MVRQFPFDHESMLLKLRPYLGAIRQVASYSTAAAAGARRLPFVQAALEPVRLAEAFVDAVRGRSAAVCDVVAPRGRPYAEVGGCGVVAESFCHTPTIRHSRRIKCQQVYSDSAVSFLVYTALLP